MYNARKAIKKEFLSTPEYVRDTIKEKSPYYVGITAEQALWCAENIILRYIEDLKKVGKRPTP